MANSHTPGLKMDLGCILVPDEVANTGGDLGHFCCVCVGFFFE